MKLVATVLVAAFVLAGGMSIAFADCAGHNKAQLVQTDDVANDWRSTGQ